MDDGGAADAPGGCDQILQSTQCAGRDATAHRGTRQCRHPPKQGHRTVPPALGQPGARVVLPAAVQSGIEPHRDPVEARQTFLAPATGTKRRRAAR